MPNINVTVYDSTENKRVPVELPDDAPCNKIVAVLVQKLRLPTNGPDGAPLSYKFHHKNSGRQIQDAQILSEAQVRDGDILRLQPEITVAQSTRSDHQQPTFCDLFLVPPGNQPQPAEAVLTDFAVKHLCHSEFPKKFPNRQ